MTPEEEANDDGTAVEAARGRSCALLFLAYLAIAVAVASIAASVVGIRLFTWMVEAMTP
ncbi:hypothetical protein [Streptomyces sp. NPDC015131]|uniref:hypothetical protein n=1 Tax=Streptomyces sp. NPDC015131 TaxID=3364941 RepID=UPI0036F4D9E5